MIIVVVGIIVVVVVVGGGGGGGGDADEWISSEESGCGDLEDFGALDEWISSEESGCGDLEDFGALEKSFGLALAKQTKTHKLIIRIDFIVYRFISCCFLLFFFSIV